MENENRTIKEAVEGLIREGFLLLPSCAWPDVLKWIDDKYPSPFNFGGRDYFEYMNSDDWRAERVRQFQIHGHKCEICGSTNNLQVHHITYERGEHPGDEDCAVLCKDCHDKLHTVINRLKDDDIRQLKDVYDKWRSETNRWLGSTLARYINEAWPGGIRGVRKMRTAVIIRHSFMSQFDDYYLRVSPSHTSLLAGIKKK